MEALSSNRLITLQNMYEQNLNQIVDTATLAQNAWGTTSSDMINRRIVTAGDLKKTTTNFVHAMVDGLSTNQCVNYGTPNTYLYGKNYPSYNDNGLFHHSTWPKLNTTTQSWSFTPTHYGLLNVYVYCPWHTIRNFMVGPYGHERLVISIWNGNSSSPRGGKNVYVQGTKTLVDTAKLSGVSDVGNFGLSAIDYNYSNGYAHLFTCPWYDNLSNLSGVSPVYLSLNIIYYDGKWWNASTSKSSTHLNCAPTNNDLSFNTMNALNWDGLRFIQIHEPVRLSASSGNCGTANVYINVSKYE